jgi:hypothetical protein
MSGTIGGELVKIQMEKPTSQKGVKLKSRKHPDQE